MRYETEPVRAIRALRLLRDASSRRGGLRGDEYDQIIRQAMPRQTAHLNWPTDLMIILLRAQLIQVRQVDRKEMMSAERFEDLIRESPLKNFVFALPPYFEDVCAALGVTSLSELERRVDPNSVSVIPAYGITPKTGRLRSDVFVLMPSGLGLNLVYQQAIGPAVEELGLSVARAEDFFDRQINVADTWQAIYGASIVVADCTDRGAAVFYELGMAHIVGRPTILLAQAIEDIPNSLRRFQHILYENSKEGLARLRQDLHFALVQIRREMQGPSRS